MSVQADDEMDSREATRLFTIHDLFEMPDDGFRYEVVDGALIMSPAADTLHQFVGDEFRQALKEQAPAGVFALTAAAVRIGEDTTGFVPDIVVTTVDPRTRRKWLEAHEIRGVMEIVSPSSKRRDRILEPHVYASIGIPCYWRIELDPQPTVHIHVLDGDAYRLVQTVESGTSAQVEHPFPMALDLREL